MTEYELFQALRRFYPAREYALLPQVANGTGAGTFRHCDALALSLWPSRGLHLSGFEMKSYRGDWVRELRNPAKAEEIAQYCNYWWIVTAGPFVKAEEIPELWGLMVWDKDKAALVKAKQPKFREAIKPDLTFIAAMLRKAQDVATPQGVIDEARAAAFKKGREQGLVESLCNMRDYESLKKRVKEFEKASGVKIDTWRSDAGDIGRAVNQVLNGAVEQDRKQLLRIAERLVTELSEASA